MKKWRVVIRKKSKGPDRWGVQRLVGYTDGRASWALEIAEPFYRRADAEAYIRKLESGLVALHILAVTGAGSGLVIDLGALSPSAREAGCATADPASPEGNTKHD